MSVVDDVDTIQIRLDLSDVDVAVLAGISPATWTRARLTRIPPARRGPRTALERFVARNAKARKRSDLAMADERYK
jgi:hypothetical protein